MSSVFVTRALPGTALARIGQQHDVVVWEGHSRPPRTDLLRYTRDVEGLVCLLCDRVDAQLLRSATHLRVVSNYAVGLDNIDLVTARELGIPVGHTPDVLTDATADLTLALLLAAARHLSAAQEAVRRGEWGDWSPSGYLGLELASSTLGIIGFGRIGRAVAKRAAAFGMQVIHTGKGGVPVAEVLARADVVSLHCPLTTQTARMINHESLARMKPGAILINTARGGLVDTAALVQALESGQLAGAGLDVTDPEPLPADDALLACPTALVVPHIGSATHTARQRMAEIAVENLCAGLEGRPLPFPAELR